MGSTSGNYLQSTSASFSKSKYAVFLVKKLKNVSAVRVQHKDIHALTWYYRHVLTNVGQHMPVSCRVSFSLFSSFVWTFVLSKKKKDNSKNLYIFNKLPYKRVRVRRIRSFLASWHFTITKTRRNVFFVISVDGVAKYWACIARLGFRKAQRRANKQSLKRLLEYAILYFKKNNVKLIRVIFKGTNSILMWVVRGIRLRGIGVYSITSDVLLPRNGTKHRKTRRV